MQHSDTHLRLDKQQQSVRHDQDLDWRWFAILVPSAEAQMSLKTSASCWISRFFFMNSIISLSNSVLILTFYKESTVYTNSYKLKNIKGLWGRGSYDDDMTMTTMFIWPLKQWMVSLSCTLGKHICCLRTAGLKAVSELFPSQLYHMTHKRKRACRICGVCKCIFLGGNNLIYLWDVQRAFELSVQWLSPEFYGND